MMKDQTAKVIQGFGLDKPRGLPTANFVFDERPFLHGELYLANSRYGPAMICGVDIPSERHNAWSYFFQMPHKSDIHGETITFSNIGKLDKDRLAVLLEDMRVIRCNQKWWYYLVVLVVGVMIGITFGRSKLREYL